MITCCGPWAPHGGGFAAYLVDVFELLEAAPADRRIPVLDDVAHLLDPLALEARMGQVPDYHPRRAALADRIRTSADLARAEPEMLMTASSQLAQLRQSHIGRWLRPAPATPSGAARGPLDLGPIGR